MSVDEAAVRKVFEQLKGQHNEAGRQLGAVRQQTAVRERELKGTVLTLREIEALPRGTDGVTCYKGVGRMSVLPSTSARALTRQVHARVAQCDREHAQGQGQGAQRGALRARQKGQGPLFQSPTTELTRCSTSRTK